MNDASAAYKQNRGMVRHMTHKFNLEDQKARGHLKEFLRLGHNSNDNKLVQPGSSCVQVQDACGL
jgi:hypothetical protein